MTSGWWEVESCWNGAYTTQLHVGQLQDDLPGNESIYPIFQSPSHAHPASPLAWHHSPLLALLDVEPNVQEVSLVAHGLAVHRLERLLRCTSRVKLHDTAPFGLTSGHVDTNAGVDYGPSTSRIEEIF